MSTARRLFYLPLLLLLPLPAAAGQTLSSTPAASADDPPPITTPAYSNRTYPQIVRLSYIQGDVRLIRGKAEDGNWDKAATDVPLEQGFSVATGNGRAEIEFEDASTAYLGENSVLTFGKLTSKAGILETKLSLLTGTLSLHLTLVPGQKFAVITPADTFSLDGKAVNHDYVRVNSYLDAIGLTLLQNETINVLNPNGLGHVRSSCSAATPSTTTDPPASPPATTQPPTPTSTPGSKPASAPAPPL
jgi:hypothetical protein